MAVRNKYIYIFATLLLVYLFGLPIDLMDIDASQYAEISREMSTTNSYLQVYELGKDYLDKPPFLFWMSSLSIKIFGVNNFAYKLPSLLFALLAIFSTYKLALLFYKKEIAILAAIVLASCQAMFLMTNDVRTDTILMGWVIFSIWQLLSWLKNYKPIHFIAGFVAIGGGMVTKGPIAVIAPILAIGSHLLITRNFKAIFKWQYLFGVALIGLVLLPMCYGLYHQFDLQPTKIVNEKTGVSGLRFFFWTQSFGRITGESVWNNGATIFFLFQNLLWAFLPWIIFFIIAICLEIKNIVQLKFKLSQNEEWVNMGGFILCYLALGSSKYQLPHYIFIVLPFIAIITAKFLYKLTSENAFVSTKRILEKTHFIIFALLWILLLVLLIYCLPASTWAIITACASFCVFIILFLRKNVKHYIIYLSLFTIIGLNVFVSLSVYPSLLQYQAGSNIGNWLNKHNIPKNNVYIFKTHIWHSLHYKTNTIIPQKDDVQAINKNDIIITPKENLYLLDAANKKYDIMYETETFAITRLSLNFLNPQKRANETFLYVIIKIR
jgi:4-amino-4-deoxy-L-arabinose transferase-like glycosyltransferase